MSSVSLEGLIIFPCAFPSMWNFCHKDTVEATIFLSSTNRLLVLVSTKAGGNTLFKISHQPTVFQICAHITIVR